MNFFEQLLVTQEHDTRLTQLAHKRASLPELQVLEEVKQVLVTSQAEIDQAEEERAALHRAQRLVEDTLASLENRAAEIEKSLYDGSVTGAKDLQDHQAELENVRKRASVFEDDVLHGMEGVEVATARVDELTQRHQSLLDVQRDAEMRLTAAAAEIDAEAEEVGVKRAASVVDIPPAILAEYDRLRGALGGVAVAKLERNRCGGCHLTMASAELESLRRLDPETTAYCEECGRILVR